MMDIQINRKRRSSNFSIAFSVFLLCSCGGSDGLEFSIPVITPIDGQWISDSGLNIQFDESHTRNRYFNKKYELNVKLRDSGEPCESITSDYQSEQLEAVFDNGNVEIYVGEPDEGRLCLTGVFTSLVDFQVNTLSGSNFGVFKNDRVALRLNLGTWASEDGSLEVLFFDPSTVDNNNSREVIGCVRSNGTAIEPVMGVINGYDTQTRKNPTIAPLFSISTAEPVFKSVIFNDVFTLSLILPDGSTVVLNREEDLAEPFCEDPD